MRVNFLRLTTVLIIFLIIAGSVSDSMDAMSLPCEGANLVRNFGSNDNGRPVLGMIFSGTVNVLAAESGEVIFSRGKNDFASRLPSPLGAWTAIDHGDGLISIYSRYAEHNTPFTETYVEKQQPIAVSGTSGWSAQEGFYFIVFDRHERRWINPEMIITPAQETRPPQILSVNLRNAQGAMMQSNNLSQGRYTVVVGVAGGTPRNIQTSAYSQQYAPQRIVCSVNGAEVGSLNFEAVSARDGVLMLYRNGLVPAKQIYSNVSSYEAAEVFLTRGQVTLEVIVQDITGNSRSVINRLYVN
ncbi:MAG: M23 family metallopeptidase [Treponema sp.]|jgi:hypothetical protein|nr:M23 family metallopeptidase [Treponema sp.]